MNKTQVVFSISAVLVVLIGSAAWQFLGSTDVSPLGAVGESSTTQPTTPIPEPSTVTTVPVTPTNHPTPASFAVIKGDSITSWDFKGGYSDNPELVAKAQAEISRLSGLLETATSSKMILSIGIANQYELLGDGKKQYDYLGRAIQARPENGLPWHNLGVLMERLGALQTARMAYEQSTIVQPEFPLYHYAYLEFLIGHMKNNTVGIEKAFATAERNIGKRQYLIDLRAEWQAS